MIHAGVWLVKETLELVEVLRDLTGRDVEGHAAVQGMVTSLRAWIARRYANRFDSDIELRRFFILADLMLTSVIGGLAELPAAAAGLAIDQIVNSAAKQLYMSGGQVTAPIVFRGPNGAAARVAAPMRSPKPPPCSKWAWYLA